MTRPSLLLRAAHAMLVPLVVACVTALIVADIILSARSAGSGGREVPVLPFEAPYLAPGCTLMPNGILVCEPEAERLTDPSDLSLGAGDGGINAAQKKSCVEKVLPPKPEAVAMVDLIVERVGLVRNFDVYEGVFNDTCLAVAGMINGKRAIVYDGERFHWENGRTRWSDIGITAHEVAHILLSHWMDGGSRPPTELEADQFSGYTLGRLGATLGQALAWTALVSETGGSTHPPRADRIKAVARGWGQAAHQAAPVSGMNAWLGETFEMAGTNCRVAQVTKSGGSAVRITCERAGKWTWAD